MAIQFVILRGFCLYCTLHALSAFAALWLHAFAPRKWAFPLALVLAAAGFWLTRQQVVRSVEVSVAKADPATHLDTTQALPWLGAISPQSPALVISLNCPACLDLLEGLSRESYAKREKGPALFFKTTDENQALTVAFVSAVLSQTGSRRDAFLSVATLLLSQKEIALSSPTAAATQLSALFPDAGRYREKAEETLRVQKKALQQAHVPEATPLFIDAAGKARALFKPEELFSK